MSTFTLFRLAGSSLGRPIDDLRAGNYVMRGEFTSLRRGGAENDLILHRGDLALDHSNGALFAIQGETIGRIGYALDLIGLSTWTLRPLTEVGPVETQEDEPLHRRPTAIRLVAKDPARAIQCLIAVPCREIYGDHRRIQTLLTTGEPVTFTPAELITLVRITLVIMSTGRIDPRTGRPPRGRDGENRASVMAFHDIFESITRAEPTRAAA